VEAGLSNPRHKSREEAREYCFLITSFKKRNEKSSAQLCEIVQRHTGLRCERADREPEPGRDLLAKVQEMILGASVVIADVTEYSPNVYYEYGYASAHNRVPVLIARQGRKLPTDVVGKEALRYCGSPACDRKFLKELLSCLERQLRSALPEQRRMLASPIAFPAYVIAAPRVPGKESKHWWHPDETYTFGDMSGITGILTAYGNLFGTRRLPELLHAQCLSHKVLRKSASFYCIGSSKVNPATNYFLNRIQQGLKPHWKMAEVGLPPDKRIIFRCGDDPSLDALLQATVTRSRDGSLHDYGLIVRAPNPVDPRYLILIIAGRHSLGTHAACMATTRQSLIKALERELKIAGVLLKDTNQPFWAIVRGALGKRGSSSDEVEIVKVGGYVRYP
jgi:hypothetical protein